MQVDWRGLDETTLVRLAQAGDLRAFDLLALRYRPAVTALTRQILGNQESAEDAAQDSLIAAYKSLPQLCDPTRFGGWLAAIARNRSRRLAQGIEERHTRLDDVIAANLTAPARGFESTGLSDSILCLPDDLRMVAELFYHEDWSTKEIAQFLSLPLTTVKWRLHESRQHLRSRLTT